MRHYDPARFSAAPFIIPSNALGADGSTGHAATHGSCRQFEIKISFQFQQYALARCQPLLFAGEIYELAGIRRHHLHTLGWSTELGRAMV